MATGAAAIDAVFRTFGKEGQILAGGGGAPCTVIVSAPDQISPYGRGKLVSPAARLEIRVSEISAIANGDTVSVEGVSYLITADPRVEDADRLVWVCDAAAVS